MTRKRTHWNLTLLANLIVLGIAGVAIEIHSFPAHCQARCSYAKLNPSQFQYQNPCYTGQEGLDLALRYNKS
ncbi:hypothetical protein EV426DRAFT_618070 [Tirmania nivea]|nr:hypothetical protein EV426DRAFT_618070 [Tirmania nivea]